MRERAVKCLAITIATALWLVRPPALAQPHTSMLPSVDWQTIAGPELRSWNRIEFVDSLRGIIADDSALFRTSDGGRTWTNITPEPESRPGIRAIEYVDTGRVAVVAYGSLYLSETAGRTWTRQQVYFNDIAFFDSTNGAAGAAPAAIFRTRDGGRTWTQVLSLAQRYPLESIAMPGVTTIVSSWTTPHPPGLLDGIFYRSTDGGETWTLLNLGRSYYPGKLAFSDTMHGMALAYSAGGVIMKTDDGGASWKECYRTQTGEAFRSLSVRTSGETAALTETGLIIRSSDRGVTWMIEQTPAGSKLRAIHLCTSGATWAVGDSGTILVQRPRLNTSRVTEPLIAAGGYILLQNYPNPFNPSTTFAFSLPFASRVTLRIYTAYGASAATVVQDRFFGAGRHTQIWSAAENARLSSGVYFLRMDARPVDRPASLFTMTRKFILLR